jgi:hypothetical protein
MEESGDLVIELLGQVERLEQSVPLSLSNVFDD